MTEATRHGEEGGNRMRTLWIVALTLLATHARAEDIYLDTSQQYYVRGTAGHSEMRPTPNCPGAMYFENGYAMCANAQIVGEWPPISDVERAAGLCVEHDRGAATGTGKHDYEPRWKEACDKINAMRGNSDLAFVRRVAGSKP